MANLSMEEWKKKRAMEAWARKKGIKMPAQDLSAAKQRTAYQEFEGMQADPRTDTLKYEREVLPTVMGISQEEFNDRYLPKELPNPIGIQEKTAEAFAPDKVWNIMTPEARVQTALETVSPKKKPGPYAENAEKTSQEQTLWALDVISREIDEADRRLKELRKERSAAAAQTRGPAWNGTGPKPEQTDEQKAAIDRLKEIDAETDRLVQRKQDFEKKKDMVPGAKFSAGKLVGGEILKGMGTVNAGFTKFLTLAEDVLGLPLYLFMPPEEVEKSLSDMPAHEFNNWVRHNNEVIENQYAENLARGGKAAQVIGNMISSTIAATPQAALALMTHGGSLPTTAGLQTAASKALTPGLARTVQDGIRVLGKDPQYWMAFIPVAGESYDQAIEDMKKAGETNLTKMKAKASLYAIGNGLFNALVEVGGGIQQLPEQLRGGAAAWKAFVDSAMDEGKEEVIQGVLERAMQSIYGKYNPAVSFDPRNTDAIFNPYTAATEWAGGVIVGAILSGGEAAFSKLAQKVQTAKATRAEKGAYESLARAAQEFQTNGQISIKTAEEIAKNPAASGMIGLDIRNIDADIRAESVKRYIDGRFAYVAEQTQSYTDETGADVRTQNTAGPDVIDRIEQTISDVESGTISEEAYDARMADLMQEMQQGRGTLPTAAEAMSVDTDEEAGAMRPGTLPTAAEVMQQRGAQNGTENAAGETGNAEELSDNRDGGRNVRDRAGGQAGVLAEGRPQGAAQQSRTAAERRNRGVNLREKVSAQDLGVRRGTSDRVVTEIPQTEWDDEMVREDARVFRETGKHVRYTLGSIPIRKSDGGIGYVRAVNMDGSYIVRADHNRLTIGQLIDHETYHEMAFNDKTLSGRVEQAIVEQYGREEFDGIVDRYIKNLRGVIDVGEPGTASYDFAVRDIKEEVLADAYAGINAFGAKADAYQETARAAVDQNMESRLPEQQSGRGPPEKFSYAGVRAKGADLQALQRAEQMEYSGKSAEEIRRETGWFRGADKQWRFEIDDSGAKYYRGGDAQFSKDHPEYQKAKDIETKYIMGTATDEDMEWINENGDVWLDEINRLSRQVESGPVPLRNVLDHEELFRRYPFLENVEISFADDVDMNGAYGSYNTGNQEIRINKKIKYNPDEFMNTALHEIQHAIQEYEGFASGSSSNYWRNKRQDISGTIAGNQMNLDLYLKDIGYPKAVKESVEKIARKERTMEEHWKAMQEFKDNSKYASEISRIEDHIRELRKEQNKYTHLGDGNWGTVEEMYRNTAGEIEARDTESRKDLTAEERAERAPDIGDEKTVFAEKYSAEDQMDEDEQEKKAEAVTETVEETAADRLPKKAQDYLRRAEAHLLNRLGNKLKVPYHAVRDDLKPIVREISNEYLENGTISREKVDELFERAFDAGVKISSNFYDMHKLTKDMLRNTRVVVPKEVQAKIPNWPEFRDHSFGKLRIVSENGKSIRELYRMAMTADPELFQELSRPEEMLQHMAEVSASIGVSYISLRDFYGKNADKYKAWAREDFGTEVEDIKKEYRNITRYVDDLNAKPEKAKLTATPKEMIDVYKDLGNRRKRAEAAKSKQLLTASDRTKLGQILRGDITIDQLDPKTDNVKGTLDVLQAEQEYQELNRQVQEWNAERKQGLMDDADKDLETANEWKDKKKGRLYARETMERNIRDIVPDQELAERIIDKYITPVHVSEAEATRHKNRLRERIRALNISQKVDKGNTVSEAYAVQLLGEAEDAIAQLQEKRTRKTRDAKTQQEWKDTIANLWAENPNLDKGKIQSAVKEFRLIYDSLFTQMNEARVRNGYAPIDYRRGYFPHFQTDKPDTILEAIGKEFGISSDIKELPTTIAGRTHTFRPGIRWMSEAQKRIGFETDYDAIQGFDKYLEGAASVIHQTDNIQRLRALAAQIRYRTGDEGIREQIDEIKARKDLSFEDKQDKLSKIYEDGRFTLSNFAQEVEEYTNLLANKRSRLDRNDEWKYGRQFYNLAKAIESRVGANMVAVNPGSWLTNFIPITQATADVSPKLILDGMWDTLKATKYGDSSFENRSTFLTNRRGSTPLSQTTQQKVSEKLSAPMEAIDMFTAESIVRARYRQNRNLGLSEEAAMAEADQWAAGVMADRSKGSMPTLFEQKSFLTKMFTQFQLEVNNQLSWMFKDLPREARGKGLRKLMAMLFRMAIGAFLYNEVYEYFIGRRAAFDPIGLLNDTVGDAAGYQLPNLVDTAVGLVQGKAPNFKTEQKSKADTIEDLGKNIMAELPFSGGIFGGLVGIDGGRLPISSALPNVENLIKASDNDAWSGKKRLEVAGKELSKPVTYLALPFGGGQLRKIYQGMEAIIRGGSYKTDAEGNDLLQYPVFNDTPGQIAGNTARALLFGKTALPTAREWIDSGFQAMSAKETAAYQGMTEAGVKDQDAYELLKALKAARKDGESKDADGRQRDALRASEVSGEGKSIVYYGLLATDTERAVMEELATKDADMGPVTETLMDMRDEGSGKGSAAAKRDILQESEITDEQKHRIYHDMMASDTERELMDELSGADKGNVVYALLDLHDIEDELHGAEKSNAKRDAIAASGLSDADKIKLYRAKVSKSRDDDILAFQTAGLSFDEFLAAQNAYTEIDEEADGAKEKEMEFSRWINGQEYTDRQEAAVREAFKYYSQMPYGEGTYDKLNAAGLPDQKAYDLAKSINALEPEEGAETVSPIQKYSTVTASDLTDAEQMQALGIMMPESEYGKLKIAGSYGVTARAYVDLKKRLPDYDADHNGGFTQEEVTAAIDSMGTAGKLVLPSASQGLQLPSAGGVTVTNAQKAVLWQTANKSWKPKNNPYSVEIGQQVYDSLHEEKLQLPSQGGLQLPSQTGVMLPKAGEGKLVLPTAGSGLQLPSQRE